MQTLIQNTQVQFSWLFTNITKHGYLQPHHEVATALAYNNR